MPRLASFKGQPTARLNVYILPETVRATRMFAAATGRTISAAVDTLLNDALQWHEEADRNEGEGD